MHSIRKTLLRLSGNVLRVVERDDESGWLWSQDVYWREGWVPVDKTAPLDPGCKKRRSATQTGERGS